MRDLPRLAICIKSALVLTRCCTIAANWSLVNKAYGGTFCRSASSLRKSCNYKIGYIFQWHGENIKLIMHDYLEQKAVLHKAGWQEMDGKGSYPHTVTGNVKALYGLYAPQLLDSRDIFVYLPPSYESGSKRYPVIYMQDGQNLFDEAISYAGEWRVDETMEQLSLEGIEAIVVGVANGREKRIVEYNPYSSKSRDDVEENGYLQFIINTVKPLIDQSFKTQPERENTGILGSSMGGLISVYAFFRFPMIFGMAGALSHWMWVKDQVDPDLVCEFIASSRYSKGRIYIDIGDCEYVDCNITSFGLAPEQAVIDSRRIKDMLINKGYVLGGDLLYLEVPGGSHSEQDWARRLPDVLRFLLSGVFPAHYLDRYRGTAQ